MLWTVIAASVTAMIATPIAGQLADRFGHRRVYLAGIVVAAILSGPLYWALDSGSMPAVVLVYLACGAGYAVIWAVAPVLFAELFGASVRFSGLSLGQTLGAILGSGLAPLIAAALLASTGTSTSIVLYLVGTLLLSALCLMGLSARGRRTDPVASTTPEREPA